MNIRYLELKDGMEFSVVKSFSCLGTKYEVKAIRQEAIKRLRKCYPTSFRRYLAQAVEHVHPIKMTPTDAMETVHIARLCDLPDILPSAFYQCTRLSTQELLEGPQSSLISTSDLRAILEGRRKLANSSIIFLKDMMLKSPPIGCMSPDDCSREIRNGLSRVWDDLVETAGDLASEYHTVKLMGDSACVSCALSLEWECEKYYQETWDRLGEYFNVRPWPIATEIV